MASLIMHIVITRMLQKKYNLKDEVLLGAILPDILKTTTIKSKEESHYMKEINDLPNIEKFIRVNMNNGQDEIKLGYLFHLIQDRIWYGHLKEMEETFEGTNDEFAYRVYSDMNIYDQYVLKKYNIDEDEFNGIKERLETLSTDSRVKNGIHKLVRIRSIENDKPFFWSANMIDKYINDSLAYCEQYYLRLYSDRTENTDLHKKGTTLDEYN